jgi:hypothetical protein
MVSDFIDLNRPRWDPSREPPRGLLPVPPEVYEMLAREEAQLARDRNIVMTPEARQRQLNHSTLDYYYLGQVVAHRMTPQGVEVLAVGDDEIGELLKGKSQEELLTIRIGCV